MIYQELQARLGYSFKNLDLLTAALTHRSFYFENRDDAATHNERLEFLGDAVLGLAISDSLMRLHGQSEEGDLTKWRASLVNESTLSDIAKDWNLQNELRLGNSEHNQRENLSPRMLSSTLEAIFGAIYLDAGFAEAQEVIHKTFAHRLENLDFTNHYANDFKTRFQEYCQKQFKKTPTYRLIASDGPAHARSFSTEVSIGDRVLALGKGTSRRSSEQEAARMALEQIGEQQ